MNRRLRISARRGRTPATLIVLVALLWPALAGAQSAPPATPSAPAAPLPPVKSSKPSRSAKPPGFQIQLDGLVYSPSGTVASLGGTQLSSLLPTGPGFAITASLGLARSWIVAARAAYFGSNQDGSFRFVDEFNTNGQPFTDGSGPFALNRELHVTNVHALLQYRHPLASSFQWELELGGGVSQSREALELTNASGEKASAVGVQLDPSFAAGASIGYFMPWNTDLVGGLRWSLTSASDGAVWTNGDSPAYLNWTLGLRYPHETH